MAEIKPATSCILGSVARHGLRGAVTLVFRADLQSATGRKKLIYVIKFLIRATQIPLRSLHLQLRGLVLFGGDCPTRRYEPGRFNVTKAIVRLFITQTSTYNLYKKCQLSVNIYLLNLENRLITNIYCAISSYFFYFFIMDTLL